MVDNPAPSFILTEKTRLSINYPDAAQSPVLANVYLHYALDLWFEKVVKAHCQGEALLIRYADDFVCAFQYREEAEKFFKVLAKRLNKFGLAVAPEKSGLMRFSRFHPSRSRRIEFLGFEMYWTHDQKGKVRVMQRTARKRLQGACRRIKDWIKQNRHLNGIKFIKALNRRLRGHYNWYIWGRAMLTGCKYMK